MDWLLHLHFKWLLLSSFKNNLWGNMFMQIKDLNVSQHIQMWNGEDAYQIISLLVAHILISLLNPDLNASQLGFEELAICILCEFYLIAFQSPIWVWKLHLANLLICLVIIQNDLCWTWRSCHKNVTQLSLSHRIEFTWLRKSQTFCRWCWVLQKCFSLCASL